MTNLDRHNDYFNNKDFKRDCVEFTFDHTDLTILKCWIVDDNGRRIPHTTIFEVCDSDDLLEQFNTFKEAEEYINKN